MRQKFFWTIPLVSHLLWVLVLPVPDWWQDGAGAGSFWDIKVQHTSLLNPRVVHLSVMRSYGHILTPWGNPAEQKIDNQKSTLYHKISLESILLLLWKLENWTSASAVEKKWDRESCYQAYGRELTAFCLLEWDETRRVCSSNTRPTMLHWLIGDGKLSQVVANHLRLHAMPITYPKNSVCLAPEPKNAAIQKQVQITWLEQRASWTTQKYFMHLQLQNNFDWKQKKESTTYWIAEWNIRHSQLK